MVKKLSYKEAKKLTKPVLPRNLAKPKKRKTREQIKAANFEEGADRLFPKRTKRGSGKYIGIQGKKGIKIPQYGEKDTGGAVRISNASIKVTAKEPANSKRRTRKRKKTAKK